jgi:CRP-like cAMP-binding protein
MRHHHDHLDTLAGVTLFQGLGRSTLELISSNTTEVHGEAGTEWTRQGALGLEAFVVLEGEAAVVVDGEQVGTVGRGEVFGEMALLGEARRTATVVATTPMKVLVLSATEFRSVLDRVPDVEDRVRAAMAARHAHAA